MHEFPAPIPASAYRSWGSCTPFACRVALALCAVALAGCATGPAPDTRNLAPRTPASGVALNSDAASIASNRDSQKRVASVAPEPRPAIVKYGSGVLMKESVAQQKRDETDAPVSLSMENGDIREVVKNLLGDLLGLNYIIDPRVQGTVSIRTARPIPRSGVFSLLETVLRGANASIVEDGPYWRVLPTSEAIRGYAKPMSGEQFSRSPMRGTSVVVYPAQHVGAKELMRLMEPFARDAANTLRIDELRNFVFISASQQEMDRLLEIAAMFDIDLLEGMSFAIAPLQSSDVKTVLADLEKVLGANNPLQGLLRVVPLERMNALLLISPQKRIVDEARRWIDRLDAGGSDAGGGQRLYVYALRYTQAEKLQPVLQAAISGRPLVAQTGAAVAPGQTSRTVNAPATPIPGQPLLSPGNPSTNTLGVATQPATQFGVPPGATGASGAASQGNALARNATIVPDKDRNSLLIVATQAEYNAIEAVIKRLDVAPKQVAIEVQIAEVTLTGEFQFGLDYYFQGKLGDAQNRMTSADGGGQSLGSGFTYIWKRSDAIKAILNLSETKSKIRTISQPTLITLENQKASFSAGTQISVRTQSSTNTTTGSVDSYQYINTGIELGVTPRVSGSSVFLDINQDLSDAGVATGGNPNPPITKRSTTTSVMVTSGDTMLLGGLFQDSGRSGSSGLPLLSSIPVLGGAFGAQAWNSNRTELVLLITPRILHSEEDTRDTVDELRKRMRLIEAFDTHASTSAAPTRGRDRRSAPEVSPGRATLSSIVDPQSDRASLRVQPPNQGPQVTDRPAVGDSRPQGN